MRRAGFGRGLHGGVGSCAIGKSSCRECAETDGGGGILANVPLPDQSLLTWRRGRPRA